MRAVPRLLLVTALVGLTLASIAQPGAAQPTRVVVIVMENQPYDRIVGSSQAPYINSLISNGLLFTNYVAVTNGSLHDYLAMTSGLPSKTSPPSANVFQAIDATGGALTWTEFEESMSGNCGAGSSGTVPGTNVPLYTPQHDPDYQYRANTTCATNDVPMSTTDFVASSLPHLSYVVPNQCDDMHTRPKSGLSCPAYFGFNPIASKIGMGDDWLAQVVPQLLAQPDITVVLTWDEGSKSSVPYEHIVTLEVGAAVGSGTTDSTPYDHYSLEAGLYAHFGLGTPPNNGASAIPLPIA